MKSIQFLVAATTLISSLAPQSSFAQIIPPKKMSDVAQVYHDKSCYDGSGNDVVSLNLQVDGI